ncbi:hypothetical protein LSH36_1087g00007 [Paralvinella palmiformis]|uniref:Uncharacterized protein n=1 Tax=Paralvinella palmiformis TaxID=53620 RepID=A0AAD9IV62_9ANNE|nr:hypothetical protein LSH36_1087g00007 [Paralvinella palmiformis]
MSSAEVFVVILAVIWLNILPYCSNQAHDVPVSTGDTGLFGVDIAKDICSISSPCPPAQSCKVLEQVGYICTCPTGYVGTNCTTECATHAADIVFLLDSSDSISDENWVKMLHFVSSVVGQLQVDEGYHRIAIITFGDQPTLDIKLTDYNTTNDIITRVKELAHKKEKTNLAGSLRLMRTAIFQSGSARNMHIGFLITDGAGNVERDRIFEEARLVKEAGIAMFAIGIGRLIHPIELEAVASRPLSKHLFLEYGFEALKNIINAVLESTCDLMPKYTPGGTGYTGIPGQSGSTGQIGPTGEPGPPGIKGTKGTLGGRGRSGARGKSGSTGERGQSGMTGFVGQRGLSGQRGPQGLPGDQGDPGREGPSIASPRGLTGSSGTSGMVGRTGPTGEVGTGGDAGVTGLTGVTGIHGVVGPLGNQGATGFTGDRGATGVIGPLGPPGEDGPTGFIYEDSDECALNTSRCHHICINERSGYKCKCHSGYKLLNDGFTCAEIDECLIKNGGCEQQCTNTEGSFVCSCLLGYTMSRDSLTCIDVDECCSNQVPINPCPRTHVCINTRGSYTCILKDRIRIPGQKLRIMTTVVVNGTSLMSMFLRRNVVIGVFIWLCALTVLAIICVLLANTTHYVANYSVPAAGRYYYHDRRPRPSGPPQETAGNNRKLLQDPIAAQVEINHRPESVVQNTST